MRKKIKPVRFTGHRPHVLVIDDEPEICRCMEKCLALLDCKVESCTNGSDGIERLQKDRFDIVFTDLRMPGVNGIEVVRAVRRVSAGTDAIVLTGFGTIESAVRAIQAGATDYLTKPFKVDDLRVAIEKALTPPAPNADIDDAFNVGMVGHSPAIKALRAQIDQMAEAPSNALIYGETGVGKELVAKAIHARSSRRMRPFVAVNCGAVEESLLQSELFGHERGAFTGAVDTRPGRIEGAHHGTLFLDEIAETSPSFQVSLLRVLQDRRIVHVRGTDQIDVDFRLIAATNKDLPQLIKEGKFREDLYYRINVILFTVPPLREHPEDIPLLVEHFIKKHRTRVKKKVAGVSPETMALLTAYSWPGNIRHLENAMEKAIVFTTDSVIQPSDLPAEVRSVDCPIASESYLHAPFKEAKSGFERTYVVNCLEETRGNISEAARKAGVAREHFYELMRKLEIDPRQFRSPSP